MSAPTPTILVSGASGQLASALIQELLAIQNQYPFKLIAASRTTDKLAHLKEKGVELRQLDALDQSSVDKALVGVDRLVLVSLDGIGKRYTGHKNLIDGAVKTGVKHIVYTSAPTPTLGRPLYDEHFQTESYLTAATSIGFTILRNTLYAETLLYSIPGAVASGGQWLVATGEGKRSYVTRGDLALAAAHAVTTKYGKDEERHLYELGGTEALNADEITQILNEELGTSLKANKVSSEQLTQILSQFLPPVYATAMASIDQHTHDGYDATLTGHFKKLVGRDPVSLRTWIKNNKAILLAPPKQ
jgi:NAD(P)H dehydrogenase (quinone)